MALNRQHHRRGRGRGDSDRHKEKDRFTTVKRGHSPAFCPRYRGTSKTSQIPGEKPPRKRKREVKGSREKKVILQAKNWWALNLDISALGGKVPRTPIEEGKTKLISVRSSGDPPVHRGVT